MATQNNVPDQKKPEDMRRVVGNMITLTALCLPIVILTILGTILGNSYTVVAFVTLWTGLFFALSLRFVRKRTFVVVERFGYFWDVKFAGPRLMIPWIDNEVMSDDFLQKSVELFKNIKIDFIGGSAPVLADAWYQIGNPVDIEKGDIDVVREQVLKYTYRVRAEDRAARIADIFQGAFRTFLEQLDIPSAQKKMEGLATKGTNASRKALGGIGVYPFPEKGIIVRDIVLPEEIVKFREQVLRGEMDAREAIERSRSYWQPLMEMKNGLEKGGVLMTPEEIKHLFLTQKGFETLQKTGSNVSLVASDIDSVVKTITVGSVNKTKGGA